MATPRNLTPLCNSDFAESASSNKDATKILRWTQQLLVCHLASFTANLYFDAPPWIPWLSVGPHWVLFLATIFSLCIFCLQLAVH